jgi:parvulin-like peptidyl-prolyl isomerase
MSKQPETPKSPSQPPLLNRKHQTRAQREAEVRQRVVIGTAVVAVLAVIILIVGAAYSVFFEPQQTMATIDGQTITREQLFRRINYERFRVYKLEQSVRAQSTELLADPNSAQFFAQYVTQQQQQILSQYENLDFTVLETMIEERLLEKAATDRGITVTDEEVNTEIRRQMAQLQPDAAIIQEDLDATATGIANVTATAAAFTPTPEVTATATITDTAIVTATAVTTDSAATPAATATAAGPTVTPFPTPTFAPTSTPNVFTDDKYQPVYSAFISEMQSRTGFTEADFRTVVRAQLFREKLRTEIRDAVDVTDVVTTEEQVHVAHILVATQEEAAAALARLQAGEDFAAVAAEISTDTSNNTAGGDLGWFGAGTMVAEFETAAFALTEVGQLSEPVQTQFGWHIIKLLEGPEQRPVADSDIEQAQETEREEAWTTYLQELKSASAIDRLWDGDIPADPGFRRDMVRPYPTPVPAPTQPPAPATVAVPLPTEGTDTTTEATPTVAP